MFQSFVYENFKKSFDEWKDSKVNNDGNFSSWKYSLCLSIGLCLSAILTTNNPNGAKLIFAIITSTFLPPYFTFYERIQEI